MYGVGLAVDDVDDVERDDDLDVDFVVVVGVVAVLIGSTSTSPELPTSIIPFSPPATGRTLPPTATAPPTPTPTTIHPIWALAVWPLLTVNVFEALLISVGVMAGGGDDFGAFVDVGWDPWELFDFDFDSWSLVVPIVGMTDVLERDVGMVLPLLFDTVV